MYHALKMAGLDEILDIAAKQEEKKIIEEKAIEEKKRELNESLDKYSQPMRPGPDLDINRSTAANILRRGKEVIKSSKGKHGKNYTPPKKKRK